MFLNMFPENVSYTENRKTRLWQNSKDVILFMLSATVSLAQN